ncbi:hypothetical protein DITRI_Ditri16bG0154000 [Diplodiscus trichospermus]
MAQKKGIDGEVDVGNTLLDAYAKSGYVGLYSCTKEKNVRSWTTLNAGYEMHGRAREALEVCYKMIIAGVRPNYLILVSVLAACSMLVWHKRAGICFNAMKDEFNVQSAGKYSCMVNLLGQAGFAAMLIT